uniref:Uncharacterized protein n=2 Tax=Equus TaxID=9789 RepID=A0A3Q2I0G6_HORSE
MRSRRRFSTSGFSICDQQERESGPTRPRLSAAALASGSRRWDSPASILPQDPGEPRARPIRTLSTPLSPTPLGSISVARLLSLPGLLHSPPSSPLSVSFSSSSFLSMSPSRAVFLCLSGELWGPSLRPDTWAARCRAQSWRP